jgi:uncharacterized cupredoxin-like copper-binding protein
VPTDTDTTRQFLVAARLFGALTAAFFAIGATALVVALAAAGHPATAASAAPARPVATTTPPPTNTPPTPTVPADPSGVVVVEVALEEFAFAPGAVTVPAGRPVLFRVTNTGAVDHELVVGDAHVQEEAEEAMASSSSSSSNHGSQDGHEGDVPSIHLGPGESGELAATFDEPGRLLLGCHVPGHWAAGMRGSLTVSP